MSQIKTIEVKNFKAIDHQAANFNGCSAIVTGGNRKGKTSLLRGIIDRIRGQKPEMIVRDQEDGGFIKLTLTTGERIHWEFTADGKEKLTYITADGKLKTALTKELANRFFPSSFDIDKFLQSTPKDRVKQLQALLGIDTSEVDASYKEAYEERTFRKRTYDEAKAKIENVEDGDLLEMLEPESTDELQNELGEVGVHNAKYQSAVDSMATFKAKIVELGGQVKNTEEVILELESLEVEEQKEIDAEIEALKRRKEKFKQKTADDIAARRVKIKEYTTSIEDLSTRIKNGEAWVKVEENMPKSIDDIKKSIESVQARNAQIEAAKKAAKTHKAAENARKEWEDADVQVKLVEIERLRILQSANLPDGITIDGDNIVVDGLPLGSLQQSTSELYIVALKLGALRLGEVGALHFDAATLDNPSLQKVQEWAEANGLQLLIERPDLDGGEIEYHLLQQVEQPVNQ